MRGRDDIKHRVILSGVDDVHISGVALAEVSLRDGRAVDVHFSCVSVTEGIDFSSRAPFGDTHFEQVESVAPVVFNDSEAAGEIRWDGQLSKGRVRGKRSSRTSSSPTP